MCRWRRPEPRSKSDDRHIFHAFSSNTFYSHSFPFPDTHWPRKSTLSIISAPHDNSLRWQQPQHRRPENAFPCHSIQRTPPAPIHHIRLVHRLARTFHRRLGAVRTRICHKCIRRMGRCGVNYCSDFGVVNFSASIARVVYHRQCNGLSVHAMRGDTWMLRADHGFGRIFAKPDSACTVNRRILRLWIRQHIGPIHGQLSTSIDLCPRSRRNEPNSANYRPPFRRLNKNRTQSKRKQLICRKAIDPNAWLLPIPANEWARMIRISQRTRMRHTKSTRIEILLHRKLATAMMWRRRRPQTCSKSKWMATK